ncbi:hypothetical protein ACDA63_10015 [Uliginosibacterium sp. sgz301328]
MMNQPSPLETLASYAIAFIAGAVATVCVAAYGRWMMAKGRAPNPTKHV